MAKAAIFITGHHVVAWAVKPGHYVCDIARNHHGVDIGSAHKEAMGHVRTGETKTNQRRSRHDSTWRNKRVLLGEKANGDGTVRFHRRAEIALHELAFQVQGRWIDGLDVAQ